jgi:hypothetical protein
MKSNFVVLLAVSIMLSGCMGNIFGGGKKTKLVPQAYMPEPPPMLMESTKPLNTIKPRS